MSKEKKINLGDEIKDTVEDALNNKNFNKLNQDVQKIVTSALDEANRAIHEKNWKRKNQHKINKEKSENTQVKGNYKKAKEVKKDHNHTHRRKNSSIKPSINQAKLAIPMGKLSGRVFTGIGALGTFIFGTGIFLLIVLGLFLWGRAIFFTTASILSPFFVVSIILLINGNIIRRRLKRFQKYTLLIKGRNYCLIKELASATGLSEKFIIKDLQKMISLGMFPQGHIDDEKTYFMITDEIYEQYRELKRNVAMKNLDTVGKKNYGKKGKSSKEEENNKLDPEVRKSIDEGRSFIAQIKEANIEIPGEEISIKLERLEGVTERIFDYVEIHPEKADEIKKFTEYFLPTTLKLVDTYKKLDYQSIQGENISKAKNEIEETLDTINLAFENLLDDLFQDLAMDVSTDISVLEVMFAQEGLTKDEMRMKNENMEDENGQ